MCFNLVLVPTFVFAATIGGWTLSNPVARGASMLYQGAKNVVINGANVAKTSTALITPTASQVAELLARGAAGYALSVAVEQLLGAVDWVLDPANNQIKYTISCSDPKVCYEYIWENAGNKYYGSQSDVCDQIVAQLGGSSAKATTVKNSNGTTSYGCSYKTKSGFRATDVLNRIINPDYLPHEEEKTLPFLTVAEQVISNAEAGDTNAQVATAAAAAAAADIVAEAENDNVKAAPITQQLEANAQTATNEDAQGETKPKDPTAPEQGMDITLEFPVFCSWAPTVCEAAQVVINFPNKLTNWWDTATNAISASWATFKQWLDWTKQDDSLPDSENVEVEDLPTPDLNENSIQWSASCPPDVQVPINLYGQSSTLVFSWSPWCQLLSIIKPAIITSAYIGAAFIVLGLRT